MDVSTSASVGDITTLAMSFRRSLRASNLSERTIKTYTEAVDLFGRFLAETGMPTAVADIRREHVESFVEHLLGLWNVEDQAHRDRRPTARRRVDPEGELGVLEDVVEVLPGRSRGVLFEGRQCPQDPHGGPVQARGGPAGQAEASSTDGRLMRVLPRSTVDGRGRASDAIGHGSGLVWPTGSGPLSGRSTPRQVPDER